MGPRVLPPRALAPVLIALFVCWFAAPAAPALAQEPAWHNKVVAALFEMGLREQCFPQGRPGAVHILGIAPDDTVLKPVERDTFLGELSTLLSRRGRAKVTQADVFADIAGSTSDISGPVERELRQLIEESSAAPLTVLLRPLRRSGRSVTMQLRLWGRRGVGLSCVETLNISVPIVSEDPACARAYSRAKADDSERAYQGFVDFFPDCPQAEEISDLLRDRREADAETRRRRQCRVQLERANGEGTAVALTRFLEDNPDCANRAPIIVLRDRLIREERCLTAYRSARRDNTPVALRRFITDNGACPQVDAARDRLDTLRRTAEEAARREREAEERRRAREEEDRRHAAEEERRRAEEERRRAADEERRRADAERRRRARQGGIAPSVVRPSFDCSRASSAVEAAICANPQLAALDQRLSQVYAGARARLGTAGRRRLGAAQRAWIRERNSCGGDHFCIGQYYQQRLAELTRGGGGGSGGASSVRPSFDCRKAGSSTERAICANSELAALDRDLSRIYSNLRGRLSSRRKRALSRAQRDWVGSRNRCGGNPGCIADAYRFRIRQLR